MGKFSWSDYFKSSSSSYSYDDEDFGWGWSGGKHSKSKYKSSLGWNSSKLSDTTSYYSYNSFYKKTSTSDISKTSELITKAYNATRDMVVILDFPYTVRIDFTTFCSGLSSSGNERRIFIPTNVIDDKKYEDTQKIDIFCGLGVHEASHLKYTTYRVYKDFLNNVYNSRLDSELYNNYKVCNINYNFFKSLVNIIEDERVEDLLLKDRPGYADFIEKEKEFHLRQYTEYDKTNKSSYHSTEIYKFLINLFKLIRFPDSLDIECVKKYSDKYDKINELISESHLGTTKDSCILALKLNKLIYDFVSQDSDFLENMLGTDIFDNKSYLDLLGRVGNDVSKMYDEINYGIDEDSGHINEDKISSSLIDDEIIVKLVKGLAETGKDKKTYFVKMTSSNKDGYLFDKNVIEKYIPSIRKLIQGTDKNYEFVIHGCRTGLLDTSKLAEAYQGVPHVYIRKGQVVTNKTTVCILIDESGSMSRCYKDRTARQAAILLNEALKGLPGVDLYIYGHTADTGDLGSGSTKINIYKEGNSFAPLYSLSRSIAHNENRDGTAIYETACRIRKYTNSHCIMFVLSDGEPCADDYYGSEAVEDTREKVIKVESMDFDVIQVSIDSVRAAERMFKTVINLSDNLSEFPKKLSNIIKKIIVKNKKTITI